jgi:ABC-type antimicrobial peptide transport system permease subunit
VRMALGARAGQVMWMVLRQSLAMILIGVAAGAVGALAAARLLERTVTGMLPAEPFTFALMVAILTLAALLASFVPARRASLVDPVRALRQD